VIACAYYRSGATDRKQTTIAFNRGGVMAFLAIRDGFPARATATFGGFTDLATYLQADPRANQLVHSIWPDYDDRQQQIIAARSAIQWPERINKPLLLMHGGADRQVSPAQTLSRATRLEALKKKYGLHIFAGDNHIVSTHRVERDRQAVLWFKEHAK
jgi:dipeptidyl aminopeptidase/acylaminoacyl peptidase